MDANGKPGCREWLRRVIFQSDTRAGQAYDIVLLVVIALSVLTVMLESVEEISGPRRGLFTVLEWVFTGLFTLEYAVRLAVATDPGQLGRVLGDGLMAFMTGGALPVRAEGTVTAKAFGFSRQVPVDVTVNLPMR